jgi:hypothetical protein
MEGYLWERDGLVGKETEKREKLLGIRNRKKLKKYLAGGIAQNDVTGYDNRNWFG